MVGPLCALLLWHSFTCARGGSPRIKIPPVVFAAVTAQQEKGIRLCGSGMREMHCNKTAFADLCFVRRTTPRPAGTKHANPYSANSMERAHCTMRPRKKQGLFLQSLLLLSLYRSGHTLFSYSSLSSRVPAGTPCRAMSQQSTSSPSCSSCAGRNLIFSKPQAS